MLKLSRTAIRELSKMYRAVLMGALITGAFVATGANAADITITSGTITDGATTYTISGATGTADINLTGYATTTTTGALDTRLGVAEGNITDLQDDMATAKGDITDLQSAVSKITDGSGNINTTGSATVGSLNAGSGKIETAGTLSAGATEVSSLTSSGKVSADNLETTNDATVGGKLTAGSTTVSSLNAGAGDIKTTGALSAGDTTVSSLTTTGAVSANTLTTTSDATVGGALIAQNDSFLVDKTGAGNTKVSIGNNSTKKANGQLEVLNASDATVGVMLDGENGSISSNALYISQAGGLTPNFAVDDTGIEANLEISANEGLTIAAGENFTLGGQAVNGIDNGTSALTLTTGDATTLATTASVLKSAENATYSNNVTTIPTNISGTTLNSAMANLDTAIGDRTLTSFNASINTGMTTSLSAGLQAAGNAIGSLSYSSTNSFDVDADLTEAVSGLDATIGDMGAIGVGSGNLSNGTTTAPTTVVDALQNLDHSMGKIHGLVDTTGAVTTSGSTVGNNSNLARGTTVSDHLVSLDNAIGNREITSLNHTINTETQTSLSAGLQAAGNAIGSLNYSSTNYVRAGSDLTSAISTLDAQLEQMNDDVDEMDKEMKAGFASMAALSGLQPNARAFNDTQISLGVGNYRGKTGFALGGFHYVNDNLMLNLGAAYAGEHSATFRGGLTFGW